MSALRLQLCGPLAIEHAAGVIREQALAGRQGRRLWAYLVLERHRPVGRDELAEALWGDDAPDAWDASLNALVSRLRTVLRPVSGVTLVGEVGRYTLRVPDEAVVDIERCWKGLLRAEAALRQGQLALATAESLIARAITARGFLAGESAPWIESRRKVLRDTRLQATELAGEAALRGGGHAEAERIARESIQLDPLRESGYRLLMRALAAGGNGAQALRVMQECRAVLQAQVGASPSAETERVYREAAGLAREHH